MQILASSMALARFRVPAADPRKRGKVLREPGAGPGLMMVEGQQFPFSLTDLWQSPQPPKIGMIVEAEFNRRGSSSPSAPSRRDLASSRVPGRRDEMEI